MSTLLPSFIVFLELKQAKFFWSVLLIFGKTESFLFHFLYSSCLSLTHSVLHGLYIILYIWDAVFSMCGTNFHNSGAYNRTVGLGSHFLCLLRGGDAESHCTWNVLCSFYQLHHRSYIGGDLGSGSGYAKGGNAVYEAICLFCNPGDPVVGCGGDQGNQLQTILFADHIELFFSSKGTSGRISPSIPISAAFLMKRSVP